MLWIGGPPGSGKTTIATRLARRHGLRWYCADWHTWEHRDRAIRADNAAALRWEALTPDERRDAAPAEQLAISLHNERWAMVVDDLRLLPTSPLIVAEGSPISPAVVSAGLAERSRAVWLMSTAEFQGAGRRSGLNELLALEIERETKASSVPTLPVDGSNGIDEIVAAVERRFAEALAEGPRAAERDQRRALLRGRTRRSSPRCAATTRARGPRATPT